MTLSPKINPMVPLSVWSSELSLYPSDTPYARPIFNLDYHWSFSFQNNGADLTWFDLIWCGEITNMQAFYKALQSTMFNVWILPRNILIHVISSGRDGYVEIDGADP